MTELGTSREEDSIAVIGIGCRFADARGPEEFWEIVRSGRNTVRDAPEHRIELGYDIDHFYDPRPKIPGKISSKKGGFLEHPELFDPAAFGIAPRDALTMEPQQRMMVEVTWDALEDAGIVPEEIAGERVAVILGYMAEDYSRERAGVLGEAAVYRGHDVFTVGGMSHAVLSGRIAYLLGVMGPSFTLDTACSSSLIATHLACQSLRRGESNLALAGGVNLFLSPEGNIALSRSGMLSMSGACKAFDASADGFVRAEGAGIVVLKRLADAVADEDPIYAVIRGSGISTDGRDGGHMMAPGRKGQAQAMRDAYAQAGVDPAKVQYVETHGTGTMIGDPVEIGALADVMGPGRDPDQPLLVASVKGNLGHTESASGVAGLIKACLAIRHRELPAQLHFETPNPVIPWDEIPVRVVAEAMAWPVPGPALVGVNSFGISGTNAHVVLESPPEVASRRESRRPDRRPILLPITAHDPNALHEMAESTRRWLDDCTLRDLEDLAYTFARRRSHRSVRMSVVGRSVEALRQELDAYLAGESSPGIQLASARLDRRPNLVMVFPGQGSQWLGMGRDLIANEPAFAESIDRIDAAYAVHVDWSLREALVGSTGLDWTGRLDVLQPLLVAFEIALAELWASWGIRPSRVVGQSLGEIAAAFVAGALGLEDVARLACHRGRIVARATGAGGMAVVSMCREDVEVRLAILEGRVEVAGVNSPTTTIVSGDREAVAKWVESLEGEGVFARRLQVDFASHCFHMDPLLDDFRVGIAAIEPREARIPFDSTVDGTLKSGLDLGPDYWVRNLREAVAFDRGLTNSIEAGGEIFLEVSPHPTLPRAIDEIGQSLGKTCVYVSSLVRHEDEQEALARNLGVLFARGAGVDFEAFGPSGRVIRAPLYAYQRERFWFSDRTRLDHFRPTHPLLGARSDSSIDPRLRSWDFMLDADSAGFVGETRLCGEPIAQSGLFLELACAVSEAIWPGVPTTVLNLELHRPIEFGTTPRRQVQLVLRVEQGTLHALRISSREDESGSWLLHASCELGSEGGESVGKDVGSMAVLERGGNESLGNEGYEQAFERVGLQFGPRSTTLRELEMAAATKESGGVVVGRLMLPRLIEAEWHAFHAHPALLEGALQLASVLSEPGRAIRVESIGAFRVDGGLGSDCWCRATRRPVSGVDPTGPDSFIIDYAFFDRSGKPVARLDEVRVRPLPAVRERIEHVASPLHRIEWRNVGPIDSRAAKEVGRWILISDDSTEAGLLATELQKLGADCRFCEKVEDLESLARLMNAEDTRPWGLVLLAWGSVPSEVAGEPTGHRAYRVGSWADAIRNHALDARQVWIATRGLQRGPAEDLPAGEIGRHVAREIETFTDCVEMHLCRLFDASADLEPIERVHLAELLGVQSEERQFLSRRGQVFVPRLVEIADDEATRPGSPPAPVLAGHRNFRAENRAQKNGAGGLVFEEQPEPGLGASSVVVEIRSVALSQLDVLADLGLARRSSSAANAFARDFAGVVTAVGESVSDLSIGDAVMGIHEGALARRLLVDRAFIARKPDFLNFNEASSLPYASVVARYALEVVGRLRAGERLLVVSASGGVGHAMVGVAKSIGADVWVTSGDPNRRLEFERLGVDTIDPSELAGDGPAAAEEFDVIVGAASGPAMHAMVSRLASGGRYLDLCPRFEYERPEMGALRLGANRSVTAIDTHELIRSEPALVSALLEKMIDELTRGVSFSMPITVFPVAGASRALRYMAQNRHRGRVCLDLAAASDLTIAPSASAKVGLTGRGPCLVSGSQGPVRERVVGWLMDRGADAIVESTSADPRRDFEDVAGEAVPMAAWVHIASDRLAPGQEETRAEIRGQMLAAPADLRIFASIRQPVEGKPARDRAWETRLWVDRLVTSGTESHEIDLDLSIGDGIARESLLRVLDLALVRALGEPFAPFAGHREAGSRVVLLEAKELAQRLADRPSPIFEDLELERQTAGAVRMTRSDFGKLSPPERRVEMQRCVLAELASVLGLSQAQHEALEPGRRLDSLGLDSLMSLELFMGLGRCFELEITPDWFESIPTLAEIGATLAERYVQTGEGAR